MALSIPYRFEVRIDHRGNYYYVSLKDATTFAAGEESEHIYCSESLPSAVDAGALAEIVRNDILAAFRKRMAVQVIAPEDSPLAKLATKDRDGHSLWVNDPLRPCDTAE